MTPLPSILGLCWLGRRLQKLMSAPLLSADESARGDDGDGDGDGIIAIPLTARCRAKGTMMYPPTDAAEEGWDGLSLSVKGRASLPPPLWHHRSSRT